MLLFRGRPVPGFSLGVASSFAQASADLQAQVSDVVVKAGDVYYQADQKAFDLDFSDATKAYQAAGQAGASNVGPEIDAAASGATTSLTGAAWTLNGQLAALVPSGAPDPHNGLPSPYFTHADADQARALVVQMIDLYQQAIVAGAQGAGQPVPQPNGPTPSPVPGAPQPPPAPSTSSSSSSSAPYIVGALALLAGAVAWDLARGKYSHAHA